MGKMSWLMVADRFGKSICRFNSNSGAIFGCIVLDTWIQRIGNLRVFLIRISYEI